MHVYAIERNEEVVYVGSTTRSMDERWSEHVRSLRRGAHANMALQRSWDKWGEEAFSCRLLESAEELDTLVEAEQRWIDELGTMSDGYNMKEAGNNGSHGPETRRKMSKSHTGKPKSPEHVENMRRAWKRRKEEGWTLPEDARRKISAANKGRKWSAEQREGHIERLKQWHKEHENPMKGWQPTDEQRQAMSDRMKRWVEEVGFSEEHRAKISATLTGREVPAERRQKISETLTGRQLSTEHRQNIAEAQRGTKRHASPETRERLRLAALAREERKRQEKLERDQRTGPGEEADSN